MKAFIRIFYAYDAKPASTSVNLLEASSSPSTNGLYMVLDFQLLFERRHG